MSKPMEMDHALNAFDALSQRTRLEALRFLVRAGDGGAPAGDIARALNVPHNTMSTHLAVLQGADLVVPERQGRIIRYRARYDALRGLIDFLVRDCCKGIPGVEAAAAQPVDSCFKGECL